jgi:hypothetical protein
MEHFGRHLSRLDWVHSAEPVPVGRGVGEGRPFPRLLAEAKVTESLGFRWRARSKAEWLNLANWPPHWPPPPEHSLGPMLLPLLRRM